MTGTGQEHEIAVKKDPVWNSKVLINREQPKKVDLQRPEEDSKKKMEAKANSLDTINNKENGTLIPANDLLSGSMPEIGNEHAKVVFLMFCSRSK